MEINIQSINFNADQKLIGFTEKKIAKLDAFFDKIVYADIYLKVQNTSGKENKVVEVKVHVPGENFLVKKECKTFEEGVDKSKDSLERILKKHKEKILRS